MKKTKEITALGAIGAIYAVFTIVLAPISYGSIQFRVSEALCLLPVVYPKSKWGLFIGCLIANVLNPTGANILDIVFGSLATLIAADLISRIRLKWLAPVILAVVNGVIVGGVIAYISGSFWASFALFAAEVALGELVVGYVIGIPIMRIMERYKGKLFGI